jgi:transposase
MSHQTRRKFSAEDKAAILRKHLVDKNPVSDVCDEYGIQPSVFYTWQRQLMENMASALDGGSGHRQRNGREEKLASKVEALEAKLAKKDNVIAEILEEHVKLKKELGEV